MFERAILKKPFEKLMDKAIEEIKRERYEDKKQEIEDVKRMMVILIEELFEEKYDQLKTSGHYTEEYLEKRKQKNKKIVYSLLDKRINKMKKDSKAS